MRSKWILPTLAILTAALVTAPASAQTIAYINALQFDLQSFRNQATAGVFVDDIDKAAWAARLLEIDGYRVYTNLSNLQDPALMGNRLITYGLTQTANPTTSDVFDCGSFLFGTTFRFAEDSDYVHSLFFQDAGRKTMFEDLEDYDIGNDAGGNDAEFVGTWVVNYDDGSGAIGNVAGDQIIDQQYTYNADLKDYEQRQARRIDFGTAKDVSQDLSAGARVFYEKDQMDLFTEGRYEMTHAVRDSAAGTLYVRDRNVVDYYGPGEEAYKHSRIGVSFNADYHPWANQSVNLRLDIAKQDVTNPGANKATVAGAPEMPIGYRVDMGMDRDYTVYTAGGAGFNPNPYGDLAQNREWRSESSFTHTIPGTGTSSGPYAVESVDDEGGGLALAFMGEYRRECYGGQSEAWLAYMRSPYDLDATIVMRDIDFDTYWWNSGSGDFEATRTNNDETQTITLDGDRTHSVLELGARWTKPVSSSVEFGGSLIGTMTKWTEDYRRTTEWVQVQRFVDGDGVLGNDAMEGQGWAPVGTFVEGEFRREATDISDVVDETKSTVIRIPFGIRYRFAQKWTWNMGSLHEIAHTQQEIEYTEPDGLSSQGVQTVTDYEASGAHVVTVSYEPAAFGSGTETVTDKWQSSSTTFFYGIEWHATENLWFYINGMFEGLADGTTHPDTGGLNSQRQISDVEFFRSLSISAKILL